MLISFLTTLMTSFVAHAHLPCGAALGDRISVPEKIQRLDWSDFRSNAKRLTQGPDRLTPEKPARVIEIDGEDALLAIDARQVYREGVEDIFERLGFGHDEPTRAWVRKVQAHFARHVDEDFAVKPLAAVWAKKQEAKFIETVFFARSFKPTPHASGSSDPTDRIALVALTTGARAEVPETERPKSSLASSLSISAARQTSKAPPNLLLTLKSPGGPRQVLWNLADFKKPARHKKSEIGAGVEFFEKAVPSVADRRRKDSGSDVVHVSWVDRTDLAANQGQHGQLFELRYSKASGGETISIASVTPVSLTEILNLEAEANLRALNPSQPTFHPNVRLPDVAVDTAIHAFTINAVNLMLQALEPEERAHMESVRRGESLTIYIGSKNTIGPLRGGRGFVVHRGEDDVIYLVGFMKTGA